jgi:hypothetical protein
MHPLMLTIPTGHVLTIHLGTLLRLEGVSVNTTVYAVDRVISSDSVIQTVDKRKQTVVE